MWANIEEMNELIVLQIQWRNWRINNTVVSNEKATKRIILNLPNLVNINVCWSRSWLVKMRRIVVVWLKRKINTRRYVRYLSLFMFINRLLFISSTNPNKTILYYTIYKIIPLHQRLLELLLCFYFCIPWSVVSKTVSPLATSVVTFFLYK